MMDPSFLRESNMKRAIVVALGTGAVISSAAAIGIGVTNAGTSESMNAAQYRAALSAVEAWREHEAARCESLADLQRELCHAETAGGGMVRAAQIESAYRRDQQSARALQRARIEARYQVERAQCGAYGGFKRDKCLVRAHANKGRALLEAAAPYEVRFAP